MATINLQRNPRYALLLVIFCFLIFLYFHAQDFQSPPSKFSLAGFPGDPNLKARVDFAEQKYQKVLESRRKLIKKHGPTPEKVVMFPPDLDPWPAYTAWDFFPPAFNCPHEVERIGSLGDGGKWICGLSRLADKKDCVIYSFGIDWDSSFESEVLSRTKHCEIWGFDAIQEQFGSQITEGDSKIRSRAHFRQLQLGPKDSHASGDSPKIYTLQNLMRANGHTHIDILKIDVEGWEFETLKSLVSSYIDTEEPLPFGQLQIEVHAWNKRFHDFLGWWEMLESVGLRPFMSEPNLVYVNYNRQAGTELADYSFLNVRGSNVFISEIPPHVDYDDLGRT